MRSTTLIINGGVVETGSGALPTGVGEGAAATKGSKETTTAALNVKRDADVPNLMVSAGLSYDILDPLSLNIINDDGVK